MREAIDHEKGRLLTPKNNEREKRLIVLTKMNECCCCCHKNNEREKRLIDVVVVYYLNDYVFKYLYFIFIFKKLHFWIIRSNYYLSESIDYEKGRLFTPKNNEIEKRLIVFFVCNNNDE